jgi:hypothetical protein
MRVARYLIIATQLCAQISWASGNSKALVVALDVPEARTPDWLCVVTKISCKQANNCGAGELSRIEPALEERVPLRYGVRVDPDPRGLDAALIGALRALRRPPSRDHLCSNEDYGACNPEIDLRQFKKTEPEPSGKLAGRMTCTSRLGAELASSGPKVASRTALDPGDLATPSFTGRRVAVIGLTFGGDPRAPVSGIQQIKLVGTTASIIFERALPTSIITFVQVLGGDYAASGFSAIGTNENVVVKLHPRCSPYLIDSPAHTVPVALVSIHSTSLVASARRASAYQRDPATLEPEMRELADPRNGMHCVPSHPTSRTLAVEIPYISGEEKKLTVVYGTKPRPTTSEVSWTEPLPTGTPKLGVRSIQFSWQRPIGCLADRWRVSAPDVEQGEWSPSCPRATISNSTTCRVISPEPASYQEELPACEYRCDIRDELDTLPIPLAVQFDRIRTDPGHRRPEIVYSWRDTVEFAGQTLTSMVGSADRRVMLEFDDPYAWIDQLGDAFDGIRVVTGNASDQLDMTSRGPQQIPPRWVSLSTPGRTCGDRIRLAIFGTRHYDEQTFEVKRGRIVLSGPAAYGRKNMRPYFLAGGGATYRDFPREAAPNVQIGVGVQRDLGGPLSLDVELGGQLTRTFYQGVELTPFRMARLSSVPYIRFDLRAGLELALSRRWNLGALFGGGLGTPFWFAHHHAVGTIRFSTVTEAQLAFTMFPKHIPTRAWLILGVGVRLFEEHMDYTTDFLGSPTPNLGRDSQSYILLRLRVTLD